MKTYYKTLALGLFMSLMGLLTSCGVSNPVSKGQAYAELYSQEPLSILVMPPINKTNKVEAKEAVYASLYHPLVEKGYYVFSPILSQELLQSESADDAEVFIDGSLKPFNQVYTADAALFTVIKKWRKIDLLAQIEVEIEYILKSTKDNKVLFQRSADVTVDCSIKTTNSLLDLVVSAVATALSDNIIGARRANMFILSDLPDGKYAPNFEKDKELIAGPKDVKGVVKR